MNLNKWTYLTDDIDIPDRQADRQKEQKEQRAFHILTVIIDSTSNENTKRDTAALQEF